MSTLFVKFNFRLVRGLGLIFTQFSMLFTLITANTLLFPGCEIYEPQGSPQY